MKTRVEISDSLLDEARKVASREGTTLRALIEAGLRKEVRERKRATAFRLRRASFRGRGLRPELASANWEQICKTAHGRLSLRNPLVDRT